MGEKNNLNLEIYEFILNDYTSELNMKLVNNKNNFYTTKLDSISPENCGYISEENEQYIKKPITDIKVRSCDIIDGTIKNMSTTSGDKVKLIIDDVRREMYFSLGLITSNDLIKFTHLFNTKEHSKNNQTKAIFESNIPNMAILYNISEIRSLMEQMGKLLMMQRGENNSATHDFIKILRPIITDKIIIIGDIHGSHATFVRILLRLRKIKAFDENCLFREDYHLIFLGDMIDRGVYGFEIICLIFMLKILNPNNVHINNGNHEEKSTNTNSSNSFYSQLQIVFGNRIGTVIHNQINSLFILNHSAIMIENPNLKGEYTYLAHGGLPAESIDLTTPPSTFPSEFSQDAFNNESNKIFIPFVKTGSRGSFNRVSGGNIRWMDFYGQENSIFNSSRGGGWICGTKIIDIANKMGIKLIIRGHQDLQYNTKLIKKGDSENKFMDINDLMQFDGVSGAKKVCYGYTHLIKLQENGNLNINNINEDIFIPVITLSTNTDLGRNLVRDSFSILKFVEEFNPKIQGCIEENSEDEETIQKNIKELFGVKSFKRLHREEPAAATFDLTNSELTESDELTTGLDLTKIELREGDQLLLPKLRKVLPSSTTSIHEEIDVSSPEPEKWMKKYLKYKAKYFKLKSSL